MISREHSEELLNRLLAACQRFPDFGADAGLWGKGLDVLERRYGVRVYLSKFQPADMVEAGAPVAEIQIVPIPSWEE